MKCVFAGTLASAYCPFLYVKHKIYHNGQKVIGSVHDSVTHLHVSQANKGSNLLPETPHEDVLMIQSGRL